MKSIEEIRRIVKRVEKEFEDGKTTKLDTDSLTPFEKLDLVLLYMETVTEPPHRSDTEIKSELLKHGISFGKYSDELLRILNKLESDGNIYTFINDAGIKKYASNFDGNLLSANNGYVQKYKDDKRKSLVLKIINFSLIFGGVAAGVYYIVELAKTVYKIFYCS